MDTVRRRRETSEQIVLLDRRLRLCVSLFGLGIYFFRFLFCCDFVGIHIILPGSLQRIRSREV